MERTNQTLTFCLALAINAMAHAALGCHFSILLIVTRLFVRLQCSCRKTVRRTPSIYYDAFFHARRLRKQAKSEHYGKKTHPIREHSTVITIF